MTTENTAPTPVGRRLLRCDVCTRTEEKSATDLLGYSQSNWPRCCGEVMAYFTEAGVVPERPRPRSPRVLIIEDNRDAAETLQQFLDLVGMPAAVAFTGPDGLAWALSNAPEVVIADIGLPGMDGYGVAEALRADPRTVHCRLVAVTGYGTEADRAKSLAVGFDVHLTKPADFAAVLKAIS